jgi:hypothetical protein
MVFSFLLFYCYDFFKKNLFILFFNIGIAENLLCHLFIFILFFYEINVVCEFVKIIQVTLIYEFDGVFFFLFLIELDFL